MFLSLKKGLMKADALLAILLNWCVLILSICMLIIVFANVICRYLLRASLFWATEVSCYILVYIVLLGGALALCRDEHIRINARWKHVKSVKKLVELCANVMIILFALFLLITGVILSARNMNSYSGAVHVPTGVVYLAAPISGSAMLIFQLAKWISR